MRSVIAGTLSFIATAALLIAGCNVDSEGGGAGATGGTTVTGGGGQGGSGGSGATGGSGGSAGGGQGGCMEVTTDDFAYRGGFLNFVYGGATNPELGGADADSLLLQIYDPDLTGTIDLSVGDNANFSTCMACLLVLEDTPDQGEPTRVYFQQSGNLDLGATKPYYIAGSLSDATLAEVTIDPNSGESTPVPNGACLHVTQIAFDIQPPAQGWTCDPLYYDAGQDDGCDCECGALDPDCNLPNIPIYGCYDGQSCNAQSHCEGLPSAWTCDPAAFGGQDGCHCGCGVPDPDCDDPQQQVIGCSGSDVCGDGKCIPATWTCTPAYYDDTSDCDCDCGAVDPDCSIPNAPVHNCSDPGETGICLPDGTCEMQ